MKLLTAPLPFSHVGTLYTLGYSHPDAPTRLCELMHEERIHLLDIRYSPRSRWRPEWNRAALLTKYGDRYHWDPRLGNVHYQRKELGITLAPGHRDAVEAAADLLYQGTNMILLCACKNARSCHRSLVAKLIQDALQQRYQGGTP